MGDSTAALWQSELLRAREWLAATRRDEQQHEEKLLQRVKAHIGFKDHQQSLQGDTTAEDEDDDLTLDFLGDVDAADMNALLQAEAAKAAAAVEDVTSASELLQPLEMPANLVSPKLKPNKVKAVPMSQLDPKRATTTTGTASATLGSDAAVQELIQDLHLDVTHHSDKEEGKTEESTPPHLLKNFGSSNDGRVQKSGSAVEHMHQVASKSPQDPHKKKAVPSAASTTKTADDVTAEMLSWVSGYRDPDVIRRKENMRRKRKRTHRYGVASEEEQRQVLIQVKRITRDSDSDSEDDFSSDYSPAEDEDVPEPDEPEVVDLLSDDYLDSDKEIQTIKRKRKRLRQVEGAQKKKKSRSRKPTVTRKLGQEKNTTETSSQPDKMQQEQRNVDSAGESRHTPATAKSISMDESDDEETGNLNHPIEVLSSGDETGESDNGGTSKTSGQVSKNSVGSDSTGSAGSEAAEGSTILRLKIPKTFNDPEGRHQEEVAGSPIKLSPAKQNSPAQEAKTSSDEAGTDAAVRDLSSVTVPNKSASVGLTEQNGTDKSPTGDVDMASQPPDAEDDLSDAGTVDFEGEELSIENDESRDEAEVAATEVASGQNAAGQEGTEVNADGKSERTSIGGVVEHSEKADEEDVSEAETEILDDDEPDTDDLGLEYSDDSDSRDKPAESKGNTSGDHADESNNKKDSFVSEGKPKSDKDRRGGSKPGDKTEDKTPALVASVQQFFDFVPLKLKPKAKTTTSTAPKPLPVHDNDKTQSRQGANDDGKSATKPKAPVVPPKASVGSNGLRPSKKPITTIATTTTKKGKYVVTRRSTKMLDPKDTPGAKPQQKSQYTMVPTPQSNKSASKDLDDVPLAILAKEMSKKPDDTPNARYLSYAGAKKTEDALSYAAEEPRIVPKHRFGGGGGLNSSSPATHNFSNGMHSQMSDKNAPRDGYRREPQISIYDALHVDGQESASDIREGSGYKRPSRFKKMQEEAARNGTPIVKSRLQDTDWDKVPIPKKKKQAPHVEEPAHDSRSRAANASEHGSRNTSAKTQNKRRKKSFGSNNKNSGPSYYGPGASQSAAAEKYEPPSRGRRGRESNSRRDDDRWRKRSPSPPSRDRDHYMRDGRYRDDRRRRGSSRSRSRSFSPRGRDHGSSRYRHRSRSRSWSRERSIDRDHGRSDHSASNGRSNASRRSRSPDYRSSSKEGVSVTSDPPELGEVYQNGKIGDTERSTKKQKTSEAPPSPCALATFDDDGDNMFVSDSDDDGNCFGKEIEDIRFDLDIVPVDEALMARQVYVTGVNATVCAEEIEEDFARFGVAVDRETGFTTIDIFPCQRTHLGRGDACVTFETKEGAQEAVEELNSKNVKNSMIRVRRMDVHTRRILTVQFQTVRDTWKCTETKCRADVSIWNPKCDKCGRARVYGPSNIKIDAESWLCSLCFTANDGFATSCHGCKESLPEVERSTFYTS